ncbi:MAG: AAA family ATPase, partial [Spirochaetales bacterium]|nr:AAA family ATPase [Spirochaetales bacterium]
KSINIQSSSMRYIRHRGAFPLVKIECDKSQSKGLFLLSGSHSLKLMVNASESLTGRVCIIELSPFSLREIMGDSFPELFLPTLDFIRDSQVLRKSLIISERQSTEEDNLKHLIPT